jgi:hypothetical protein
MARPDKDEAREKRIMWDIVVDAYDEEERAMGWHTYLEDKLQFPFRAKCTAKQSGSPLRAGEEVEVVGMPEGADYMRGMFVLIRWHERELGVPLAQLEAIDADAQTQEAIEDWHYWVARGYEF